jgi:hypothetical protein
MKEIIFALLAAGIGFGLLFFGYRLARIFIPLWGLFAGFSIGAAGVADATNEGFISTSLGIIVGLVMGLVFALFAYFFYSLAVVLLGASVGYWIGTGFMSIFGLDKGFLSAAVGISLGIVFALLTIGFNGAKYLLIGLTSLAGAVAITGGILVLFGQIEVSAFDYTTAKAVIDNSWIWSIVTALLLGFGLAVQYVTNKTFILDSWTTEYGAPKSKTVYVDNEVEK